MSICLAIHLSAYLSIYPSAYWSFSHVSTPEGILEGSLRDTLWTAQSGHAVVKGMQWWSPWVSIHISN